MGLYAADRITDIDFKELRDKVSVGSEVKIKETVCEEGIRGRSKYKTVYTPGEVIAKYERHFLVKFPKGKNICFNYFDIGKKVITE